MLQNLHVKNLALIDEAEVEFKDGLNILTGETGAGKSIILGSVNLALGGRYTKDIIRKGTQYALVELTFLVSGESQIRELASLHIYPEDGAVVLSRRLMEGRSISRINGETVSIATLKEVAGILIDIHGQHEHQSLLYEKHQMEILDAYAGAAHKETARLFGAAYNEYRTCKSEYEKAQSEDSDRVKEAAFLEFEIAEIRNAALKQGEDEALEADYRRMCNGKKIVQNLEEAYTYTGGGTDANASEYLSRAIRCLSDASACDTQAATLQEQLTEIDSLLNDVNREMSKYVESLEFSDEDFYETEERLNEINRLKSKYGNSVAEIEAYAVSREERLGILNDYEQYMQRLAARLEKAGGELKRHAAALSKIRRTESLRLGKRICEEIAELNFADVRFEIEVRELPDYTPNGKDEVEFRISMNPGEAVKPLAEVASGGELSRIMLAIKTVMADKDKIETLIFDEIDVGISGRTAQKVSEKMNVIGRKHQVICITHLAQIAAMADTHFLIEKSVEEGNTRTGIRMLREEEAVEELARILGGAKITETVLENAREMKLLAKHAK